MVLSITCIFICSPIFSQDKATHMNVLLFTTRYGNSRLVIAKLTVALIFPMMLYLFGLLLILGIFGFYFGFSGGEGSVQLNLYWQQFSFPNEMNFFQLFLLLIVYYLIGLLFTMSVTAAISRLTSTSIASFGLSLGVYFAPLLLYKFLPLNFLTVFPSISSNVEIMLKEFSKSIFFIKDNFSLNIFINEGILILLSIVILWSIYRSFQNKK